MRRCSKMASRSGVRTGILFAAATPAAWESERAFTANGSPANAALRTRRAAALPDAHPTERLFTAQGMVGWLAVYRVRVRALPVTLTLDRTLNRVAGMAARSETNRAASRRLPVRTDITVQIVAHTFAALNEVKVSRMATLPIRANVKRGRIACPATAGQWTLRVQACDGVPSRHGSERTGAEDSLGGGWRVAAITARRTVTRYGIERTESQNTFGIRSNVNIGQRRRLTSSSNYARTHEAAELAMAFNIRIRHCAAIAAGFNRLPRRQNERLSAVHHHDIRIAAHLASPYAAHRAMIGFMLPLPYDWRRTRTRQLRAEPFALLNARRHEGVPSRHEWRILRDGKSLLSTSAIAPMRTTQSLPATWNGYVMRARVVRSHFNLCPLRIESTVPARWLLRGVNDARLPTIFDMEKFTRVGIASLAFSIRIAKAAAVIATHDVYRREWKVLRSALRFDMRPIMSRLNPSFSTVEINRRAQEWPAGRWNTRTVSITSMTGRWNDPLPMRAIASARWQHRTDKRGWLASMHEVALREYVHAITAFAAAWLGNRTPNGQNRYATIDGRRVYGFFGRFHVAYGARRDHLRDLQFRRTAHGWTLRASAAERLTGASWSSWQTFAGRGPAFRFDQSGGPPPPIRTTATWDWRPFGATRDGLAAGWHTLAESGVRLVARDVITGIEYPLGFLPADDLAAGRNEVVDVTLPDGDYEIEARPSSWFWTDARPATAAVYRLRADADPVRELPEVTNLHAELTRDYWRVLSWSLAGNADADDFAFGVWLNETEPPDLAADPDITIPRRPGLDYYEHLFQQTAPQHVAVATFTPNGPRGRPARIFLDWNADAPASPAHQWATGKT